MHQVVLIDDHPLFRSGVKQLLQASSAYDVLFECDNMTSGRTFLRSGGQALENAFFVIDVSLPDGSGYDLLTDIQLAGGTLSRCCMLSMHDDYEYAKHALDLGAAGYVVKSDEPSCIVRCLDQIGRGRRYISPGVRGADNHETTPAIPEGNDQLEALPSALADLGLLSKRELRILLLVAEGRSSKEIGDQLFISPRTVENHRAKICRKLGVSGAGGLVAFTIKYRGILPKTP